MVEQLRGKLAPVVNGTKPERPDEGKQITGVHVLDRVRPPKFSTEEVFVDEKVGMKVRDGGDVPRVTSQAACTETAGVVGEICDDRFNDLLGEFGGASRRGLGRGTP